MKSSFCIDLQRFMLIPTKFPLILLLFLDIYYLLKTKMSVSSQRQTSYLNKY